MVDCANNGNAGCAGGQIDLAFQWVAENGIPCEKSYPYIGLFSHCKKFQSRLKINGFVDVPANNTEQMLNALNFQPISVGMYYFLF
jgi:hypothetical protein